MRCKERYTECVCVWGSSFLVSVCMFRYVCVFVSLESGDVQRRDVVKIQIKTWDMR